MKKSRSIRLYLVGLVIAVLVLPIAFGAVLVVRSAGSAREAIKREVQEKASAAAADFDREIGALQSQLLILASSKLLQTGDFAGFHAVVSALFKLRGMTAVLSDLTGQQLVNTRLPFGTPLPGGFAPLEIAEISKSRAPVISQFGLGGASQQPVTNISVPVRLDDTLTYVLGLSVTPALEAVLARQRLPEPIVGGLFDRNGVTIARSQEPERFVGRPASAELAAAMANSDEGSVFNTARDGTPLFSAFSRVRVSGWTAVVGIPSDIVFAPVRESEYALVALGGGAIALALILGVLIGGRIARTVSGLVGQAQALGRGAQLASVSSGIREVDIVSDSLVVASQELRRKTEEQAHAHAALEAEMVERKRMEQRLVQAQKMEAIGQLTGGVAHDFNNLLGIVIGNIDLLSEGFASGSEQRELSDAALQAATHGATLTRQLLAFARRQPLAPQLTDIRAALEATIQLLRRTLGDNVTLALQTEGATWPVLIDISQLETALVNLAVNARSAMPHGGRLTIEAKDLVLDKHQDDQDSDSVSGEYVVITVADTGEGMTSEVLARAFDPFFTTKGPGASGLGLSMVQGFVTQSGGHVTIDSEPGHGTKIGIYLPRVEARGAASDAEVAGAAAVPVGAETILVVEDNPGMRDIALRQLHSLGYRTVAAGDAAEALEIIGGNAPIDLLFTDIMMPGGMDGKALADAARRIRPTLKILFTSGFTEAAASSAMANQLGIDLLGKPYRKDELARRIRGALDAAGIARFCGQE